MTTDHIKMPDVAPVIRYLADGVSADFTYPFPIFASEDMVVTVDGAVQVSGFMVEGAGDTAGGTVSFATAPGAGLTVVLERRLPIERVTDFLEGGAFSSGTLNTELDYLTASIQQVDADNDTMLRYPAGENPGAVELPSLDNRANMVLGFDGSGNPIAYSPDGVTASPDFTAPGAGAVTRTSTDKFTDMISIKDFGAIGDGLTDDTLAIQQALAAHDNVYVPPGSYIVSSTITLDNNQSLIGAGTSSVLAASNNSFNVIEMPGKQATLQSLKITGGDAAVKLFGNTQECTQNTVSDLVMDAPNIGILLDGGDDPSYPCYWNNFDNILVEHPATHGVHMTLTGAGDTPNANRFTKVRVFSKGAATSGHGFYVEDGSFNNAFVDCEADVNGASAQGCFTVGAGADTTMIVNLYTESENGVPNVKLEAGSVNTSIMNLLSASDGAAILDESGGEYTAYNAGSPYKNVLAATRATDITSTLQRYDTEYIDASGTLDIDTSHSVHLVSSFGGALELRLPAAGDATGAMMVFKKIDPSANLVTISELGGGAGPDGSVVALGGENDTVTMLSNGAEWFVLGGNRMAGNTRFFDGSGTYDIDMAVDTYLLSAFGGAMTARLPPANSAGAIGRTVTIKKTDVSANAVTVTEQGGSGPDNFAQPLSAQYEAITVVSDGAAWWITARF